MKPYSLRALFVGRGWWDTAVLVAAWVLAIAGIWWAARKGTGWGSAISVAVIAVAYTLIPWIERLRDRNEAARLEWLYGTVTVDDWGVTRVGGRLREAVAWRDLVWVCIQTTEEGPGAEDFFFLLGSADGKGCVVPNFIASKLCGSGLATSQQLQLAGFEILREQFHNRDDAKT